MSEHVAMAKDEFALNLRTALGLVVPSATADSESVDLRATERALFGAALWLSPRAVEGFDTDDFPALEPEKRRELGHSVGVFRSVAAQVSSTESPTIAQRREGWEAFCKIIEIVRDDFRRDWLSSVDDLLTEAKGWCDRSGWVARIRDHPLRDRFLGDYESRKLLFVTDDSHYSLEPVARYVSSASGLVDLAVLPSYESARITRSGSHWLLHPVRNDSRPRRWSERSFRATVAELAPFG